MLEKLLALNSRSLKLAVLMTGFVLTLGGGALGLDVNTGVENTSPGTTITVSSGGTGDSATEDNNFSSIIIENGGHFDASRNIQLTTGGAITIGGNTTGSGGPVPVAGMNLFGAGDDPYTGDGKIFSMNGGTLKIGNTANASGGYLQSGAFRMSGGDMLIEGMTGGGTPSWEHGSYLVGGFQAGSADETSGTAAVSLTGGNIKLGDYGYISSTRVDADESDGYHQMIHIDGANIEMAGSGVGKESIIRANGAAAQTSAQERDGGKGFHSKLIMDSGNINVSGQGVILSRETHANGGIINVGSSGKLTVAGSAVYAGTVLDSIQDVSTQKWGSFNINGSTIENEGIIDFVTGNMTLNATGGSLSGNLTIGETASAAMNAGSTYSKNLTVSEGTFTVGGNLTLKNSGDLTKNTGTLIVNGATNAAKALNLGGINIFRGGLTAGGGVTMGTNSTLNLGDKMITTTLNLASGTKLIWSGAEGSISKIITSSSAITASGYAKLQDYLDKQRVSNLARTMIFTGSSDSLYIDIKSQEIDDPSVAMSGFLSQSGSGHMTSGLNSGMINAWAKIAGDPITYTGPVADLIQNHITDKTSSAEMQSVVSTLAGFDSAKSLDIAMITADNVTSRVNSRVADNNIARAQPGFSSNGAFGSAAFNNAFANRFWMGGFGLWEDADQRGFDNGYKYQSGGFIAGYDRVIGPFTLGGSYAFTAGSYEDKNQLASDSYIDSYAFTLYGTYNHPIGFFATPMIGYTYTNYDMANLVAGGTWDKSRFHSNTWTFGGNVGYDIRPTESLSITPTIGLYYYTSATNRFDSTLRNGLKVDQDSAELPIDVTVNYDIPVTRDATVRLTGNVGYARTLNDDGGDLDGFTYKGVSGSRISGAQGRDNPRNTWNLGIGARYAVGAVDAGLKYDYYTKSDYNAHRLMGTVGFSF